MWEEVINLAINNGIWAVLFLGLLIFQLRDSRSRETKYTDTIKSLSSALKYMEILDNKIDAVDANVLVVKEDVNIIKNNVASMNNDVTDIKKAIENNSKTKATKLKKGA